MTISGVTNQQYETFLDQGGELTFTIDRKELSSNDEFEDFEGVREELHTGFELPPTQVVYDPTQLAYILALGDNWTRVVARTYSRGGKIVYRKLLDGRFEAKCSMPKPKRYAAVRVEAAQNGQRKVEFRVRDNSGSDFLLPDVFFAEQQAADLAGRLNRNSDTTKDE